MALYRRGPGGERRSGHAETGAPAPLVERIERRASATIDA